MFRSLALCRAARIARYGKSEVSATRSRTEENWPKPFSTSSTYHTSKDKDGSPTAGETEKEPTNEKKTQSDAKEALLNVIGGMKVELSAKKTLQAFKMHRLQEQAAEKCNDMESASSMFQKATEDEKAKSKLLKPELVAAASAVASSMPFDQRKTESELLQQLRRHEEETDAQKRGETTNIGNIISEMKIGKRPVSRPVARPADQIRYDDDGQGYTSERGISQELAGIRRRGLFTGKRLNIFTAAKAPEAAGAEAGAAGAEAGAAGAATESPPTLWDFSLARQIASLSKRLPRNGFEEMIQWTKEGKLWEYPINNEAGLEEEQNVEFHKHVFLEEHLEDFPKQGPIRHFMELVICGLSKNPYLSVKQKMEHIQWYHDYFQQKEDILKESGISFN